MRNMSFALTTTQVRRGEKNVTRRLGWATLRPGTLVQPVLKSQGLKKGETVEKICAPIRILKVTREPLSAIAEGETVREGFPDLSRTAFVEMFCRHNKCRPDTFVTRIVFAYTEVGEEWNRDTTGTPAGDRG